jgi:hypothetical protein
VVARAIIRLQSEPLESAAKLLAAGLWSLAGMALDVEC